MAAAAIYIGAVRNQVAQIQNADASNKILLVTPGASGSKVEGLSIASTDTAARDVQLVATKGAVDYILTTVTIPANSGNLAATPPIDLFSLTNYPGVKRDQDGKGYIMLDASTTLSIKALTTVTAAKLLQAMSWVGDF